MKINLNDKWTIKKAKELYTYTSGISKGSQFFGTGYPYLTFTEIFHNYFVPDELTSLVQSNDRERENCSIKRGDVFLTRTSETDNELGMSCVALKDYPNATFNGFTKRLRPLTDEVVPEYAGFYFRSPIFRAAVTSMSSIITRASLNEKMLDKLPICYPSKPTQQKIASILSAYDNLIQNYKKQIEALQTAASELYKEWFVRFRFPGWQNANFENGIPEGWKVVLASELGEFIRGKNITAEEMQEGMIPVISAGIEPSGFHNQSNVKGVSLTISNSGANAGYLQINYSNIWAADCSYCNSDKHIYFYYELLNNMRVVLFNLQKGAAQPHVYAKDINKMKILLPPSELIETANKKIKLMHEKIYSLQQQITNLTQQRDLLLPRLMSGKLEVLK